ncbi:MAG: hypothetical protein O2973_07575 [Gemmatimonadetes bacterium]|nr:hypothetical protein [Gemmatimonadota bacterium]
MIPNRRFLIASAAAMLLASPSLAQRGARGAAPRAVALRADTVASQGGQGAFALDFQNQELQVVLSALAEAGDLNITMTNVPAQRVTVRMARGFTRDTLVAMIRGLSEANGVKFTAQGSLIRLEGDPALAPAAQITAQQRAQQALLVQQQQAVDLKLYTYRLKHANAVTVAPVLMNLLGGTGGGGFGGAGGGLQLTQIGRGGNAAFEVAAAAGAGGGGGGGRGGRGGNNAGGGRGGAAAQQQALVQGILGNVLGAQGALGTLSNASAQIRIVADEPTNSLLIRSTLPDFELIQALMQGIDLRPLQVLIEVTIAEVSRSSDLELGLSGAATRKGATNNAPRDTVGLLPGNASARDFIFKLTSGNGSINYNAAINALQTRGDVKVLSMPVIIAQNNKEAILNVGEDRPFVQVNQSVSAGAVPTTVQTVQYIPVGTTLTITPTINPDGYVNMAVNQTNNSATNEIQFSAPVISKREATTQIFLRDGQTTVIGGLAGNNTSQTVSGIPFLSRIPFIGGFLFGNTSKVTTTNELFLFLTPHIISSDEDIDRYRNSLEQGTELLKEMPLGPRIVPGDSAKRFLPPDTTRRRPPGR